MEGIKDMTNYQMARFEGEQIGFTWRAQSESGALRPTDLDLNETALRTFRRYDLRFDSMGDAIRTFCDGFRRGWKRCA